MSKENILNMIENNAVIQDKLKELGITENGDRLKVELKYSELLSEDERKALKKQYKSIFSKKTRKEFKQMGMVVKYTDDPDSFSFCRSDAVCDNCYQSLQKRRRENSII
ncbi:hypothetical protein [Winogradskyella luteola]|uniref:Uncharacterized protein n=1 Tax=Winogradskyella luteola TaxID=2828330 RepID=A0A9X1F7E9_9FLAO|nr:hypothetical protein [Winogradskyella luteola]MBV7268802.1 hypothetical protein [Winogradskyella luteola]